MILPRTATEAQLHENDVFHDLWPFCVHNSTLCIFRKSVGKFIFYLSHQQFLKLIQRIKLLVVQFSELLQTLGRNLKTKLN